MTGDKNVHLSSGHSLSVAFRLSGIEGEVILVPYDQQTRLLLEQLVSLSKSEGPTAGTESGVASHAPCCETRLQRLEYSNERFASVPGIDKNECCWIQPMKPAGSHSSRARGARHACSKRSSSGLAAMAWLLAMA